MISFMMAVTTSVLSHPPLICMHPR